MFWERFVTIINLPTASALAGKVKPVACSRLSSKRPCSIERQKLRSLEEVTVCMARKRCNVVGLRIIYYSVHREAMPKHDGAFTTSV